MRLSKKYLNLAAASLIAAGTMVAQSTPPSHPKEGPRAGAFRGGDRMASALGLTDAQKEQVKALHERQRTSTQGVRDQMRDVSRQLHEAVKAGDASLVQSLSQQKGVLSGQLTVAMMNFRKEFRALLTPEQQAKLDQMQAQRENKHWKRNKGGNAPAQNQ